MQTIRLMNKPEIARQGDVLIVPAKCAVDEKDIGKLIKEPDKSRVVLAHGEATGHAHAFYPALDKQEKIMPKKAVKPVQLFELSNKGMKYADSSFTDVRLLRLKERALLRHEEHDPISFPAGDYIVIQQHEYDDSEELRRVAD